VTWSGFPSNGKLEPEETPATSPNGEAVIVLAQLVHDSLVTHTQLFGRARTYVWVPTFDDSTDSGQKGRTPK
jgi:hypothetical protein